MTTIYAIAGAMLIALCLSASFQLDNNDSAALADAKRDQREQLRLANAERALEKSLNRGTK